MNTTSTEGVSILVTSPVSTRSIISCLNPKKKESKVMEEQAEWHQIGATTLENFDIVVHQLTAILATTLEELLRSRKDGEFLGHGIILRSDVMENLRQYITRIGQSYQQVNFHSFAHAFHVTISAHNLLQMLQQGKSFGIDSNPMVRFALCFAALIHDVDHQGVPNATLIEEEASVALFYNGVSVAEQHSICFAFELLATPEFHLLRQCIMPDAASRKAFRQQVVDLVLATDINSSERILFQQWQWEQAGFAKSGDKNSIIPGKPALFIVREPCQNENMPGCCNDPVRDCNLPPHISLDLRGKVACECREEVSLNIKRQVVLGILINIADVSHTMQRFETFVAWNKRLFQELHSAHSQGRLDYDPSGRWFDEQVDFLDKYVLPLAMKAQQCGVFGCTKGSVFVQHALENKRQWQGRGLDITRQFIQVTRSELRRDHRRNEPIRRNREKLEGRQSKKWNRAA